MLQVMQNNNNNRSQTSSIINGGSSNGNSSNSERNLMHNVPYYHSHHHSSSHVAQAPPYYYEHSAPQSNLTQAPQRRYSYYQPPPAPAMAHAPAMFHEHIPPSHITSSAVLATTFSPSSSSGPEVQYPVVSVQPKKKRIGVACTNCRASHKKCSEERPCRTCVDLGIPHLCCDSASSSQTKKVTKSVTTAAASRNVSAPLVNSHLDDRRSVVGGVNRQTGTDPYYYSYVHKGDHYPTQESYPPSYYSASHYNVSPPQSYPESFPTAAGALPPSLVPAHFIPTSTPTPLLPPSAVAGKRVNAPLKSADPLIPNVLEDENLSAPKPSGRAVHSSIYRSQHLFHPYANRSHSQYSNRGAISPASKSFDTNEEKALRLAPLVNCPEDRTEPRPTPLLPAFETEVSLPSFDKTAFPPASNK